MTALLIVTLCMAVLNTAVMALFYFQERDSRKALAMAFEFLLATTKQVSESLDVAHQELSNIQNTLNK
jgi:hypothetical protein